MAAPTNPIPSNVSRDENNVAAFNSSGVKITAGKRVSVTPGTPVNLVTASTPCRHVVITAYLGNSGSVAIGDQTNVLAEPDANDKTGQGIQLMQGASTVCNVVDASLIYMDVADSGDGVSYLIYA